MNQIKSVRMERTKLEGTSFYTPVQNVNKGTQKTRASNPLQDLEKLKVSVLDSKGNERVERPDKDFRVQLFPKTNDYIKDSNKKTKEMRTQMQVPDKTIKSELDYQ